MGEFMSKNNFSRDKIIEKCQEAIKVPWSFYRENFIRSEDGIKGEPEVYRTEIIAEFVLNNLDVFENGIIVHPRENYFVKHDGQKTYTNHVENDLEKELYVKSEFQKHEYDFIGRIKNYQVPMLVDGHDKGVRAFDLFSVNNDKQTAYILELKKKGSTESMLRCVMEAYTYLKIVCKRNLLNSYGIPEDYSLKASPLVFREDEQWKQMMEVKDGKRPMLRDLMDKLDIKPFYLTEPNGDEDYIVTEE